MTSSFVKNEPALQLLSYSASFSWVLQREAQGKAWVCLARPPPMPGDNREPLGEIVGVLLMVCTSWAKHSGKCWGRNREFLTGAYAKHPAALQGRGSSAQEIYWPFIWGMRLFVCFFWAADASCWSAGQRDAQVISSQRKGEVGEMGLLLKLNDDFHLFSRGRCNLSWLRVSKIFFTPQRVEHGGQAAASALSRGEQGGAGVATVIRSVMRGAWE